MTSQAQIFQVLRDLAEQEGGWSQEVRELLARDLVTWRLASCWTSSDSEERERYHRIQVGDNGFRAVLSTIELDDRAGLVYQWYWWAGEHRAVRADSMAKAKAAADTELRALGYVLLDLPLEQLAARLRELGEWPGFIEDMVGSSCPEASYPEVWNSHGHDTRVRQLLVMLGWAPPPDLPPPPDLSWLRPGLVLEVHPPIYTYEGFEADGAIQGARAWLATRDPRADWELGPQAPARDVARDRLLYHVTLRTRVRLEDYAAARSTP
jgi:hypothetical protein